MIQAAEETEDQGVFANLCLFYNDSLTVLGLGYTLGLGDTLELGTPP